MAGKTIPLSVRVTGEDSDFLAGLEVPGAATPSDKIRSIIRDARMQHEGEVNYEQGLAFQEQRLAPLLRRLRAAEHEAGMHSELMVQFLNWLPEVSAFLHAELGAEKAVSEQQLQTLEQGIADRMTGLLEACLRLAVTPKEPCYSPNCVRERTQPIIELSALIESSIMKSKGVSND